MKNTQIFLTPNEGKQLIADALASLDFVQEAMREHTVVVVMGTTNAYLANALLSQLGEEEIANLAFKHADELARAQMPPEPEE